MTDNQLHTGKDLFERIGRDDHTAFRILVDRYRNNLYGQAMAYLKDSHKAQDIVQEVFLSLWQQRRSLGSVGQPENYLFTIARNKITDEFRKKLLLPLPSQDGQAQAAYPAAEDIFYHKQLQLFIQAAVDRLPPQQKAVFELRRNEGLKYEEIASRLGISKDTVKGHLVKAMSFVRTAVRQRAGLFLFVYFFS